MQISAIIFDFNGVLVNDERLHFQGFQKSLEQLGMELGWSEYCEKYLHYGDRDFFRHYLADQKNEVDLDRLIDAKTRYYFQQIETCIPSIDATVAFIRGLEPSLPLAIASAADRREIEFILQRLGLLQRFGIIVSAGDVVRGKPHPESFKKTLTGLQLLDRDLHPAHVLVVEDSYRGIDAAHAAGLKCLALSTSYPAERLARAELVLENLEGWDLPRIEAAL